MTAEQVVADLIAQVRAGGDIRVSGEFSLRERCRVAALLAETVGRAYRSMPDERAVIEALELLRDSWDEVAGLVDVPAEARAWYAGRPL